MDIHLSINTQIKSPKTPLPPVGKKDINLIYSDFDSYDNLRGTFETGYEQYYNNINTEHENDNDENL